MLQIDVLRLAKYNQIHDPVMLQPEMHSHSDYYQLYFRLSGKAYVSCGEESRILSNCNEIMFAPPHVRHQFKLLPNQKGPLIVFDCKFRVHDPQLDELLSGLPRFIKHSSEAFFLNLLENSIEEAERKLPFYKSQIDSNVAAMLIALIRICNPRQKARGYNDTFFISDQESYISGIEINALLEYLDAHMHNAITLDDLSRYLKINKTTLIEVFKKQFGITPNRFITQRRIEKAKKLLLDDSLRVGYISDVTGFRNLPYFCSVFKKETGTTPMEFRSRNKCEHEFSWGKT